MEKQTTTINQYLTFKLEEETYALDISRVHSVLDFEKITKVPKIPDFMRGVINLRGSVVPIVDLKLKFGLPLTEKTIDTCVIIVEIVLDNEPTVLGILADSVQEVINLETSQIEPPPKIGTRLRTEFITGMGKKDDEFIILLDLDKVFTLEELSMVQEMGQSEADTESEESFEEVSPSRKRSSRKRTREVAVEA